MGCFNMSCAVTGTPIMDGDDMIVAVAAEADQMRSIVAAMFFEAKYNDYGTYCVESLEHSLSKSPNDLSFKWFCNFINTNGQFVDDVVRTLVKGTVVNEDNKEDVSITYPGFMLRNHRVVYIHKAVWDKIVAYQAGACEEFYYFNPSTYRTPEQVMREQFEHANKRIALEQKMDDNPTDTELLADARHQLVMMTITSMQLSSELRGVFDGSVVDITEQFCKKYNVDFSDAQEHIIKSVNTATAVSNFLGAVNSNITTRYSGQDTSDQEHEVMVSLIHDQNEKRRHKWDE